MGYWRKLFGLEIDGPAAGAHGPRAAVTGTPIDISSSAALEEALRTGTISDAGQPVTEATALRVAAAFACVRVRAGVIANTPLAIKQRVDDRTRMDATGHPVWSVMNRRPNAWQTPSQFKRMMEAHVLLRGEAYAVKSTRADGSLVSLTPLHPDRVRKVQRSDLTLEFEWTRADGTRDTFRQDEMFHLVGLSLDGVNGLSVLGYARETIGLSLAQEQHGATVFKNGANVSAAFSLPQGRTLQPEQVESLRSQLDEHRAGGGRSGKAIVLEDGMSYQQMALNSEDAQWLASREFSRTDVCMFFGVPPHIIGITAGNTQLGSSIDAQTQAFVTFSLEDSFTGWEEAIGLQCLDWVRNPKLYARFTRNALVRGDIKTRWDAYVKGMQWGVMSPNDVLAAEDENPRPGGDIYYPPPNMTGGASSEGNQNVNP